MISVIIPVYNSEQTINKAVDSLLVQTIGLDILEIILVDDGSTDQSAVICDNYANAHSNIIVLHTENRGVSASRNAGLEIANGDYIGFVDSDDWVDPDMFSVLLRTMMQTEADLVACGIIQETDYGSFSDKDDGRVELFYRNECYGSILNNKGIRGYLVNKLFRKELIIDYLDEKLSQCEDLLFVADYLKQVKKVAYVNRALYHYRRQSRNVGFEYSVRSLSLMEAYEKILEIYNNHANNYVPIVESYVLKIYLNYRARYLLLCDSNPELWESICEGRRKHWHNVMRSESISKGKKANILLTYLFPRITIKAKYTIKKMRHRRGRWES